MADDPIGPTGEDPEKKLRELFDSIEREEGGPSRAMPTNDEIRADLYASPLESQLNPDSLGPEERIHSDAHPPSGPGDEAEDPKLGEPAELRRVNMSEEPEEEELSEDERKLRELDERLRQARATGLPEPPEWNFKRPDIPGKNKVEENNYFGMGVGISIAYTLVGATLAGWGIGKLIDMRTGGSMGQAIGTLCGAVVGLLGAIVTIVRAQNKPGS